MQTYVSAREKDWPLQLCSHAWIPCKNKKRSIWYRARKRERAREREKSHSKYIRYCVKYIYSKYDCALASAQRIKPQIKVMSRKTRVHFMYQNFNKAHKKNPSLMREQTKRMNRRTTTHTHKKTKFYIAISLRDKKGPKYYTEATSTLGSYALKEMSFPINMQT